MDGKKRRFWAVILSLIALAFVFLSPARFLPGTALAAESSQEPEPAVVSQGTEEIRALEEAIIQWKRRMEGEEKLLAGSLLDGAGSAGSDWFAFDISRMGIEDNQAAYLGRMKDAVEKIYQNMDDSLKRYRLSDLHRIALTIEACGGDAKAFGTDPAGNPINLINDTVWNSIWGDPGNQGINGYIWALLTVDSTGAEEPEEAEWTRDRLVESILSRQLSDGGFGLVRTDPADVDLTSMALTALVPYGNSGKTYTFTSEVTGETVTETVDEAAEKAFACLSSMQQEDGTMLTYDERTSESTAWALMALSSWGRDPGTDKQFIKNGKTLIDGMKAFCLDDGGIVHSLDGEKETVGNNMAGYQTLYGLEAVCRLREGNCRVFDFSDAGEISEAEIESARASLKELRETEEKTGEEAEEDTENRTIRLTAAIAGAVVALVVLFLVLLMRDGKKKKGGKTAEPNFDPEDEEEDW